MDICWNKNLREEVYRQGYLCGYRTGYQDAVQDKENEVLRQVSENEVLDAPIETMDIPVRVVHCLDRLGYRTVREIANLPAARILSLRGIGKRSAVQVANALRAYGVEGTEWEYAWM